MVDIDSSTPGLGGGGGGSGGNLGSDNSATKLEELKQLLLDATTSILVNLSMLKREIQTITTSDLMKDKKAYCEALIEISKKIKDFPYEPKGYQPGKVPDECAFHPKLIAFHNNMDLLAWENCSKICLLEEFIHTSSAMNKLMFVGITLQDVRRVLANLPIPEPADHRPGSPRSPKEGRDPGSPRSDPGPPRSPRGEFSWREDSSGLSSSGGLMSSGGFSSSPPMENPLDSPKRSARKETTLMLRSATGSVRGTKMQVLKELEKVDDVITQRSQSLRGTPPAELFMEMMTEKATMIETNPIEFREKLLGTRRKGAGRHASMDQGVEAVDMARKLKNRHNSDPPTVQRDTQAEKGGFHLLSLFIPPSKSSPPTTPVEDGDKSPFLSRTRSVSFFRQTGGLGGGFKLPSPDLTDVPPIDLTTDPSHRLIANVKGYRIDNGQPFIAHPLIGKQCVFVDADKDTPNYVLNFFPSEHYNFLGHDKHSGNPIALSAVLKQVASVGTKTTFDALALIRTMEKDESFTILGITSKIAPENISGKKALRMLKKKEPKFSNYILEEVTDPQVKKNLKDFEEKQLKLQYRMGVLYCKNGQTTEDEMYSNVDPSPEFLEFLDVLGTTIELQDWTKFRGGLDVRGGTTGVHAVYTEFHNYQIMFHVSTMLPFQPDDAQRVERKRHLGNDVVLIVFIENDGSPIVQFDPSNIKSQFNHVFIAVQVDRDQPQSDVVNFKLSISCKDGVPLFGPDYPQSYSFPKGDRFRQFLLTKLINAERAALRAPTFAQKIKRTRKEALQMMYNDYIGKDG